MEVLPALVDREMTRETTAGHVHEFVESRRGPHNHRLRVRIERDDHRLARASEITDGRVPSHERPSPPGFDDVVVIQVERTDGGAAGGACAHHMREVVAPPKVVSPRGAIGMEQGYIGAGVRICGDREIALELVAGMAGDAQILTGRLAAK
ncbi:MAG: hypothetical protein IT332_04985 [Ardenticatenales bacterium]|nr:hypothetical protein [Ardenticatenales bacterium]